MKSDVVLHNFTPGSPESGYLQYDKLKKVNPKIIVTAVSSYGKDGPYAKQVGLDFSIQGISGSMWINGFPGEPPVKNSIPGIDVCTALSASLGTMFALYYREKTGVGQEVDTSLFDSALFLTQSMGSLMLHAVFNENRTQVGNFGFSTYMSCLRAKDGWVMVVPTSNDLWRRLARAIGREDMADDPRFQSDMDRCKHTDIINPVVEAWVAERSVTEVTTVLKKYRVPCDPVITVAELLDDPQAKAREMVINMEDPATGIVPMPGLTIKLSQTPGHLRGRAPVVGEHNEEIYCNLLGLEAEQLRQLEQEGVI